MCLSPRESEPPHTPASPSLPLCSLFPPKAAAGQGRWAKQGGSGGGQAGAEQPSGSGMPGIQVTRGCKITGSSEEPRTAWRSLPRERKRLQSGPPETLGSQKLSSDFLSLAPKVGHFLQYTPFCLLPATGPLQIPAPLPFLPLSQRQKSLPPHPTQPVQPSLPPVLPTSAPTPSVSPIPCRGQRSPGPGL